MKWKPVVIHVFTMLTPVLSISPCSKNWTHFASRRLCVASFPATRPAERLQVADVVRAALVFGNDVVHLQGPLVLMGAAALAAAPCPCEHPVVHRAADRAAVAGAMAEAAGFSTNKQATSSPRCSRNPSSRWRHSCSSVSRSLSLSSSAPIRV
jgi:hypothetical protein